MGSVFKKTVTRPIPPGAETVVRQGIRLARWKAGNGRTKTAPIITGRDGAERIRDESSTYFARYRDGDGLVIEAATGCRDESAARQVLADLERRSERVRSGLITSAESRILVHLTTAIAEHVAAFIESMKGREVVAMHRDNTRRHLEALARDCGFASLSDLNREALERWLGAEAGKGRSARSRNAHRTALVSFANWCITAGRLSTNPFKGVPKANEAADPRRRRRSMTELELVRLLEVARRRPLLDAMTVRRGKRKGEAYANVRDEVKAQLEAVGRERALLYKTLVLTGLRKNELATLTVAQVRLDAPTPFIDLDAADEKSREGNGVVLRADLADDLRRWLDDKLAALRADAERQGEPVLTRLPGDAPLLDVPAGLVRIFDRDLKAAGIAKRDDRGRTLDVHALRTTFGTLLSKGGVSLRTAQAAMRHSDPSLTANVYTDPRLLDVHGALDALPNLPLEPAPDKQQSKVPAVATGTYAVPPVALPVAGTGDNPGQSGAFTVKMNSPGHSSTGAARLSLSVIPGKEKGQLTTPVIASQSVGAAGFEPTTSRPPV